MIGPQSERYLKIAVDIPVDGTDVCPPAEFPLFDYRAPPGSHAGVGHVVAVRFGPRRTLGYVLDEVDSPDVEPGVLRDVGEPLWPDPLFCSDQLELARWMAHRYLCRPLDALKLMLPPGLRLDKRPFPEAPRALQLSRDWRGRLPELDGAPAQRDVVLAAANASGPLGRGDLARAADRSPASVDALVRRNLLSWVEIDAPILPGESDGHPGDGHDLTDDQREALRKVSASLRGRGDTILLHGVTGSGKTEVYLRAVTQTLDAGGSVLILVPEISLTPQMIDRVTERLSEDVALLHSSLSPSERARAWKRLHDGDVRVALGPRSAIFAPCRNVSLIVLDEEHENSYKQDVSPRYHAREVAIARASIDGATVILGSATPSLESYHRARGRGYVSLGLPKRVGGGDPPLPSLVDMRSERKAGNLSVFSAALASGIRARLKRGEQTVLFLNQRGYSSFVMCPDCGNTIKCRRCSVTMTYHRDKSLQCHYCDLGMAPPKRCPACGGHNLVRRGLGTQKIEAAARSAFPGARIVRMDSDSVKHRGARENIYREFSSGEIDILIGTQMITKGWDVPSVSLVGIIDADTALHFPDFRGSERTFQLITQVSGRAGRGMVPGEVIVQTWNPEHPALDAARRGDLEGFYGRELRDRQEAGYPPFSSLLRIIVRGEDEREVANMAGVLGDRLRTIPDCGGRPSILGPSSAPLERIRGEYRWHLFAKFPETEPPGESIRASLRGLKMKSRGPRVALDVDPVNML